MLPDTLLVSSIPYFSLVYIDNAAMGAMAVFSFLCLLCAWWMRIVLKKQNRTLSQTGATTTYPY
jgi:hypothetical protein